MDVLSLHRQKATRPGGVRSRWAVCSQYTPRLAGGVFSFGLDETVERPLPLQCGLRRIPGCLTETHLRQTNFLSEGQPEIISGNGSEFLVLLLDDGVYFLAIRRPQQPLFERVVLENF